MSSTFCGNDICSFFFDMIDQRNFQIEGVSWSTSVIMSIQSEKVLQIIEIRIYFLGSLVSGSSKKWSWEDGVGQWHVFSVTTQRAENPLCRKPIGPKTHWAERSLGRKPIGPKVPSPLSKLAKSQQCFYAGSWWITARQAMTSLRKAREKDSWQRGDKNNFWRGCDSL